MKNLENAAREVPILSERPTARKKPDIRLVTRAVDLTDDAVLESPESASDFNDDEITPADQTPRAKQMAGMDAFRAMARNDKTRARKEAGYTEVSNDILEDEPIELSSDDLVDIPETQADRALAEFANGPRIKESDEVAKLMAQTKQNIERIEGRIAHAKSATERAKLEKQKIELDSALYLAKMDFEAKQREEMRDMESAARSHFAGERAHAEGAEFAQQAQRIQEAKFENELAIDEEGNITGLLNVPGVTIGAFYRGMAPAMQKINQEILTAQKTLKGRELRNRMTQLQTEADMWFEMEAEANGKTEQGAHDDETSIRNEFYLPIDVELPAGLSKSEAETLSIESKKDLDGKIESLTAQDQQLTKVIEQASEILWDLASTNEWQAVEQKMAMSEVLKAAEAFQQKRNEGIDRELEVLRKLDKPENLDLRSQRLTTLIQQSEEYITHLQGLLGRMNKKSGTKKIPVDNLLDSKDIRSAIDKMESKAINYKSDLTKWHTDPIRKEAMEARHLELEQDMRNLEIERARRESSELSFDKNASTADARAKADLETHTAKAGFRELVIELKDELYELVRQKAENANELAAALIERDYRDGIDIDLSDLEPDVVEAVANMEKAA